MDDRRPAPADRQRPMSFNSSIREILLNDWDPHNAARMPEAAGGVYDRYVESLADLLKEGATEEQLIAWLHERELESMCFSSLGTRRLIRVARKLLAISDCR